MPIIILLIFISKTVFSLHTIIIADYRNNTSKEALDSLDSPLKEVFAAKFAGYGIQLENRTQSDTRSFLTSNTHETILRIQADGSASAILNFSIETGDDHKIQTKQIAYNFEEDIEQNLTAMAIKILHVFENTILSRVQITSDPTFAPILIDNKLKASTPWESYLPTGNHELAIKLEGFEPLEKTLAIVPGSNRLNFTLMPLGIKDTIIIHEKPKTVHSIAPAYFLALAGAGLIITGIAQWQYSDADKKYQALVSNNKQDYDELHQQSELALIIRNSGIGFSISGIIAYTIKKLTYNQTS